VIAIERKVIHLRDQSQHQETGYYATSADLSQFRQEELLQIIRDHWAAIENGSHLRRDVAFREDECQVSKRGAAQVLAALRNLALALYEQDQHRGHTKTKQFKSWCRKMTAPAALKLILSN
jgi:predicted transposase YbfD/YdcC